LTVLNQLRNFFAAIAGCVVSIFAAHAFAAQATLAWDPNTESDLAGYKIYYGTASGRYTAHLDVHTVTTSTVTGLTDGQLYFFAAPAYDAAGNESGYSNEVRFSTSLAPLITAAPKASVNPVTLPATTTVSVTASDSNGDALTYAWSKAGGPGTASFTNASAASTAVAFSAAGSYTLQVAVSDGKTTVTDNVTITVLSNSSSTRQVASFTLVNAATNKDIGTLANGDVINLSVTGTSLNIRANVSGSVGSVRFGLDKNTNFGTESAAPYALAGDSNGDYAGWTPAQGGHSLTATPYSGSGGTGTAGTPLSINFTVTNDTSMAAPSNASPTGGGANQPVDSGSNSNLPQSDERANDETPDSPQDDPPPHFIAVFRPGTGEWLLDLNANFKWDGKGVDGLFKFGQNGDLPVTGDWNNDGIAEIGVFRPSTGEWLLDLNGNDKWDGSSKDGLYRFGTSGDRPVAGQWEHRISRPGRFAS